MKTMSMQDRFEATKAMQTIPGAADEFRRVNATEGASAALAAVLAYAKTNR